MASFSFFGRWRQEDLAFRYWNIPKKLRRLKKGKRNVIQDNQLCAKNVGLQDFRQILLCLCQAAHFFLGDMDSPNSRIQFRVSMVLRGISMEGKCAQPMLEADKDETEKLRHILVGEGLIS